MGVLFNEEQWESELEHKELCESTMVKGVLKKKKKNSSFFIPIRTSYD